MRTLLVAYPLSVIGYYNLVRHKLVVRNAPNGGVLRFSRRWPPEKVDEWLRSLLGPLFKYLDAKFVRHDGDFHWVFVYRCKETGQFEVLNRDRIDGADLCGFRNGRSTYEVMFGIFFVLFHSFVLANRAIWSNERNSTIGHLRGLVRWKQRLLSGFWYE